MDKIKKFFSSDIMRRVIAISASIVITCILCMCSGIDISKSLGSIACSITTMMICIFLEERVYHAGSIAEAFKKMSAFDISRYCVALVFDVELLFFLRFGGYVRLIIVLGCALFMTTVKLIQSKKSIEKESK